MHTSSASAQVEHLTDCGQTAYDLQMPRVPGGLGRAAGRGRAAARDKFKDQMMLHAYMARRRAGGISIKGSYQSKRLSRASRLVTWLAPTSCSPIDPFSYW